MDKQSEKLIKKCNNGAKVALNTLECILPYLQNQQIHSIVNDMTIRHRGYVEESNNALTSQQIRPNSPSPIVRKMAGAVTKMRLKNGASEQKVAMMIIKGADKGIAQINEELSNRYEASESAKKLAHKLIVLQQDLIKSLRIFL